MLLDLLFHCFSGDQEAQKQPTTSTPVGGGVGRDEGGQGYVLRDYGWVKITKIVRSGAKAFDFIVFARNGIAASTSKAGGRGGSARVAASVGVGAQVSATSARSAEMVGAATSVVAMTDTLQSVAAKSHDGGIDWLSADEILLLMEHA